MNNDFIYDDQKQLIKMWKDKYYEQKQEIERLNNVINELGIWLLERKKIYETKTGVENNIAFAFSKVAYDKLQELKEIDSNEKI